MTDEQFDKIAMDQIQKCSRMLFIKNKEYSVNDMDRFYSFKLAAAMQGCSIKRALAGMMAKHTASIYSMCRGGDYDLDQWVEKITDHINYLILLRGIIEEEKGNV